MQNWEVALQKFLKSYLSQEGFEGAILCGSYASDNQTEFSDIDVQIIFSDEQNWRERGNRYVDGFLIEYFSNPIFKLKEELVKGINENSLITASMLGYGKILYDTHGLVKQLQAESLSYFNKDFAPISEGRRLQSLYGAWDTIDEFKSLSKEGLNTDIVYGQAIVKLLNIYCCYHGLQLLNISKLEKFLSNPEFAKRYHIKKLPPKEMIDLTLSCIRSSIENRADNIGALYEYVTNSCGSFDIGSFTNRLEISK